MIFKANELYMIGGMALVTFGIRYLMLPITGRFRLPDWFAEGLRYVPPVVLTAIIVPAVLLPDGASLSISLVNPYIWGAVAACIISWRWKNLLLTIVASMIFFLLAKWGIGIWLSV